MLTPLSSQAAGPPRTPINPKYHDLPLTFGRRDAALGPPRGRVGACAA